MGYVLSGEGIVSLSIEGVCVVMLRCCRVMLRCCMVKSCCGAVE